MNNYNYVPGEHNPPIVTPPPYTNNWEYANGNYYSNRPIEPAPKKKKSGTGAKVLSSIALVLACGVSGFGGGYLAVSTFGPQDGDTVVYRSPENQNTLAGLSTSDTLSKAEIAAMAGKSVVSITTENLVSDPFTGGRVVSGAGSGVIISENGTILTNNHVVEGAKNIQVTLPDGEEYEAEVLGTDPRTDMAAIQIKATNLTPAVIGNSDKLQVGESVIAIGNPMGTLSGTVTDGIVSALNREVQFEDTTMNLIQMSAAVSPGNSGGGLFNEKGELIGIVNAKSGGQGAEGLGFAIPVNTAMQIGEELIHNGRVTGRPALGINVLTFATDEEAQQAGAAQAGVYIVEITPGGGAEEAGLKAGDRIVAVEDIEVETTGDVGAAVAGKKVGDTLMVTVEREKELVEVPVILGELAE